MDGVGGDLNNRKPHGVSSDTSDASLDGVGGGTNDRISHGVSSDTSSNSLSQTGEKSSGKIKKVGNAEVNSLKIKGSRPNSNFGTIISQPAQNVKRKNSLSENTQTQKRYGDYNVSGEDVKLEERLKNSVDFDHGQVLIMSGNAKYTAEVVVGITDSGDAVFYDVVIEKETSALSKDYLVTTGSSAGSDSLFTTTILQKILDVKIKNSLSANEQTQKRYGNYNVSGEDVKPTASFLDPDGSLSISVSDLLKLVKRTVNGEEMDVNVLSSAYSKNVSELVREAVALENIGEVGVYYIKKGTTLPADSGVQFPVHLSNKIASNGIIHEFSEKVKDSTQSRQLMTKAGRIPLKSR